MNVFETYRAERARRESFQVGMNACHELSPSFTREKLVSFANLEHAAHPQYSRHFDAYELVRLTRDVTTKAGEAFKAGDVALAKYTAGWGPFPGKWIAYSIRNRVDTQIDFGVERLN